MSTFQFLIGILFDSYWHQDSLPPQGLFVSIPYRYSIRLLLDHHFRDGSTDGLVSIPYRYSIRLLRNIWGSRYTARKWVSIPYRYSIRLLRQDMGMFGGTGIVSIPYRYSIRLLHPRNSGIRSMSQGFQFLIGILFDSYCRCFAVSQPTACFNSL